MLTSLLLLTLATDTLQERIDRAAPGDVVRVPAGIYREHLVIRKALTLVGEGRVVIDGEGRGTVLTIENATVTLRGFMIRGSGDNFTSEDAAVRLENADGCVIEDCRLEDVLFGLYVAHSSRCLFRRLWIGGKALPLPRRGDGVRLWYSDDTLLEEIEMADSRDFIIWFATRTVVRNCRVARGRYGLHYMYCTDNRFENNVFTENQVGGTIMHSRRITMIGNRFERSRGPSAYGMLLKDADDVIAQDNEFVDNTCGLSFVNSPQDERASCTLRWNLFALNDQGLSLMPDTRRVHFEANSFIDNIVHVEFQGSGPSVKNVWIGNYWSGSPSYDADGDGVSDVPYRPESAYENLVAAHPELALLRFSPSVGAIEMAARLFPVWKGEVQLEDPCPAVRATVRSRASATTNLNLPLLAGSLGLLLVPAAVVAWCRSVLR